MSEGSLADWDSDELLSSLDFGPPPEETFEEYLQRLQRYKNVIAQRAVTDPSSAPDDDDPYSDLIYCATLLAASRQTDEPYQFFEEHIREMAQQKATVTSAELLRALRAQSWHVHWSAAYDEDEEGLLEEENE